MKINKFFQGSSKIITPQPSAASNIASVHQTPIGQAPGSTHPVVNTNSIVGRQSAFGAGNVSAMGKSAVCSQREGRTQLLSKKHMSKPIDCLFHTIRRDETPAIFKT